MRIGIGCDHGGYEMKEELKRRLTAAGHTVADRGIYSVSEVDYPDVAVEVAKGVVADEYDLSLIHILSHLAPQSRTRLRK